MTFSFIPRGGFLMGSPEEEGLREVDGEELHRVTLTKGYRMGTHPITQAQWRAVTRLRRRLSKEEELPVDGVSWDGCEAFCRMLFEQAGVQIRLLHWS